VADPDGSACAEELAALTNPFAIEDDAGAFHTTGWLNAFETRTGPLAVAAGSTDDVVAAVRFCAEQGLRVVAKGTGHDYLGRSSDPDALTVWTHRMRQVTVHDAFRPQGAGSAVEAVPAVSVGAGARWLEAYQAVQTHNRYVQGGGCTSVGVIGLTLGGGFGSFSRRFGTAAGNLLEAEVVTASGAVLTVNDYSHPDLFWALRGGGFGLGVVTRLTLRTHAPPATLGAVQGTIKANTDDGYRRLIRRLVEVFRSLCDDHWGEQVRFLSDRSVEMALTAADITESEANAIWEPFQSWVADSPDEFRSDMFVVVLPFGSFWDRDSWDALAPEMIRHDERPGQPNQRFWWASNQGEVSQYLHAYQSRWLPAPLLSDAPEELAESLFQGAQRWPLSLHFNKALFGASSAAVARDRTTAINPAVFEAAALVLTASSQLDAYPRVAGHGPDLDLAAERAARVTAAMAPIRAITPNAGSYVNETDYFEEDWQESFWGDNYERLLSVKRRYDPDNLFCVHHGVGSEL
jgi:FAD/FMN-containing dehydrogenase